MSGKAMFTLRTIRELRGFTQAEAAEKLGISKDTLSNWERGKNYPDVPMIKKIEGIYNVAYDQIIFLPLDYDKTVNLL